CLNPWDKTRVSGGSSGGSAVAVAACLSPVALGTDTGGSIRQPASFCGVVGLRPTYGRVSRYGVIAYASSFDQVGAFARSTKDCAVLTKTIAGWDSNDSTSMKLEVPDYTTVLNKGIKGLRIGIPKEYFREGVDAEVRSAVMSAIEKLQDLGAIIVEISLPHTDAVIPCYYILVPAEASSNLARYDGVRYGYRAAQPTDLMDLYCRSRSEGFGEEVQRRIMIGTYVLSSGYYDAYYRKAQKVRALVAKDFREAFERECDVIACPVSPTTAFKLGDKMDDPLQLYLCDVFTGAINLAGVAGMSVPCGFDGKGLPIGLQLVCKPFDESILFQVAAEYERATEWHKKLPVL
ncbi:MAG: Asp-tRNA(Asn)/Glu-tRNA(Gln) amidotransferase subunit GatA, partial [SAR324 cluster bacterium]|nr:Asp-tRNA(Asn)/Glu-tRNA(Gln) amidotransferase subunit GatA [SAR324 cluster bacterium]